ncbi:hypothetical protein B4U79_14131 [Dinothrombium tinctorium]|uniref:Reelin domain-containing protein n=1 Tax=Dinothrombium tinctorium TaxID=1965070 RepID=A0A443QMK5_9ACAR|nr:hypothetical protein B4U79_14131 [Dinothrombium tinctorium]
MDRKLLIVFCTLCIIVSFTQVKGWPRGVPKEACNRLEPKHEKNRKQSSPAPFELKISKDRFSKSELVTVTISGKNTASNNQTAFKGFLVVARQPGSRTNIGLFKAPANGKLMNCSYEGDSVTHKDPTPKNSVTFQWTPPSNLTGSVSFL